MRLLTYQKLFIFAAVLLVVVNGVYFVSPARSQHGAYFSDEFNMGDYAWSTVSGSWKVVNGEFTEITKPDTQISWTTAGSLSWTDYSVQVKVYSRDTDGNFFIAGRWQNENTHYGLEYSCDAKGAAGSDTAKYVLYSKKNGVRYDLLEMRRVDDVNVPYIGEGAANVADNPYPAEIKLKFKGSNIEVYANDKLIGFTADTTVTYGKIALGEYNRSVYYDDIYVWDVTPPTLYNIEAKEIKGSAATIAFSTDENTSYRLDYGTTLEYGSYKVQTSRGSSHEVDLINLDLNTTYYYKITVTDAAGNQTISEGNHFVTSAELDTVAPVLSDVSSGDITHDSATIYWNTTEPANSIIEWGTEPGIYKWSLSYEDKTTNHAVYLRKLDGLTTYYFRAKSRDLSGNLGISEEYSFTTLKNMKPKITAVRTGSTPSVNVAVYWQDVPTAVNYKVYFSTSNDWGEPVADIPDEDGKTQYYFNKNSLSAYTNYFIRIYAIDGEGVSGYSATRAFPPSANPHGFYWDNPELCGNCHYTHSAIGPRLITEVNADRMCVTCHDGTQSKYDVLRGKFRGPESLDIEEDSYRSTWYDSIAGPYGTVEGLHVQESAYTPTSRHDLNIFNFAAPGNSIENIEIGDANLSCSTCHDPHGTDNYRNLRANMRVLNDPNAPLITVEAYPVTDTANKREDTVYVSGSVTFCGACHSDFNQGAGASRTALRTTEQPGMILSNSSMHMYMHPVNVDAQYITKTGEAIPVPTNLPYENGKIICQTCHFAHGTINSGTHIRRDGFNSTCLKRFDKTVGCEDCHDKTNYPD